MLSIEFNVKLDPEHHLFDVLTRIPATEPTSSSGNERHYSDAKSPNKKFKYPNLIFDKLIP